MRGAQNAAAVRLATVLFAVLLLAGCTGGPERVLPPIEGDPCLDVPKATIAGSAHLLPVLAQPPEGIAASVAGALGDRVVGEPRDDVFVTFPMKVFTTEKGRMEIVSREGRFHQLVYSTTDLFTPTDGTSAALDTERFLAALGYPREVWDAVEVEAHTRGEARILVDREYAGHEGVYEGSGNRSLFIDVRETPFWPDPNGPRTILQMGPTWDTTRIAIGVPYEEAQRIARAFVACRSDPQLWPSFDVNPEPGRMGVANETLGWIVAVHWWIRADCYVEVRVYVDVTNGAIADPGRDAAGCGAFL